MFAGQTAKKCTRKNVKHFSFECFIRLTYVFVKTRTTFKTLLYSNLVFRSTILHHIITVRFVTYLSFTEFANSVLILN